MRTVRHHGTTTIEPGGVHHLEVLEAMRAGGLPGALSGVVLAIAVAALGLSAIAL